MSCGVERQRWTELYQGQGEHVAWPFGNAWSSWDGNFDQEKEKFGDDDLGEDFDEDFDDDFDDDFEEETEEELKPDEEFDHKVEDDNAVEKEGDEESNIDSSS